LASLSRDPQFSQQPGHANCVLGVLSSRKDGLTIRITEVYNGITLDTELDDKLFVLPK